jgi:acyl transferase domain-containing protein
MLSSKSPSSSARRGWHVLPLSAANPSALVDLCASYESLVKNATNVDISLLCSSVPAEQRHLPYRVGVVSNGWAMLVEGLRTARLQAGHVARIPKSPLAVLLVFESSVRSLTSLLDHAVRLYESKGMFRTSWAECFGSLTGATALAETPTRLRELLSVPTTSEEQRRDSQVCLDIALQYGVASVCYTWGVQPIGCVGSGLGELVAAACTGLLSASDALAVAVLHSRAASKSPPCASFDAFDASSHVGAISLLLSTDIAISLVEASGRLTLAGKAKSVAHLRSALIERGLRVSPLRGSPRPDSETAALTLACLQLSITKALINAPLVPYRGRFVAGRPFEGRADYIAYFSSLASMQRRPAEMMTRLRVPAHAVVLSLGTTTEFSAALHRSSPLTLTWLPSPLSPTGADPCSKTAHILAQAYNVGASIDWAGIFAMM